MFQLLQIDTVAWSFSPSGEPNTAGNLQLRSLDLAKFGQLYQQDGTWNDTQILTKNWVEASTAPSIPTNQQGSDGYGYFFWHEDFQANGTSYPAAFASGNGGNKVIIFDELDAVIVITCTAYGQIRGHLQAQQLVEQYLLPAITQSTSQE